MLYLETLFLQSQLSNNDASFGDWCSDQYLLYLLLLFLCVMFSVSFITGDVIGVTVVACHGDCHSYNPARSILESSYTNKESARNTTLFASQYTFPALTMSASSPHEGKHRSKTKPENHCRSSVGFQPARCRAGTPRGWDTACPRPLCIFKICAGDALFPRGDTTCVHADRHRDIYRSF